MRITTGLSLLFTAIATPVAAQTPAPTAPQAVDYSRDDSWLCRPDRIDACATDQTVTVVNADGSMRAEPLVPDTDRAFDCFYVYPTVSLDPAANSDMVAGPEEKGVAHAQAARFRQHCRVFAPLYRQVTMRALRSMMTGGTSNANGAMAYGDVAAAWKQYLANDNKGRGVVLIGHSQGSRMVNQLLTDMTDPAERSLIVSAMPIGYNVERSADGKSGDFPWMPPCERADQAGCVVAYETFRSDFPPPANSRFGRSQKEGMSVLCA